MQAFHVRHSHPVPRWNTHTMHRWERGELSCKGWNPTMPRPSRLSRHYSRLSKQTFHESLKKTKDHARTTQAYTDKQRRFHHVKSRLSRMLSTRHPFHANSCKGETIRRVLMDKQSRSFPKPHGEENLTCKRNKQGRKYHGLYHQGKIYFISEEKIRIMAYNIQPQR